MDRVGDTVEGFLRVPLRENLLVSRAATGVSTRSRLHGRAYRRTSPIGTPPLLYETLIRPNLGLEGSGHSPVIAHCLREREDVSSGTCAERGVHQHINIHHFWVLETVIEPHGRIHRSVSRIRPRMMVGE